MCIRDRRNNAGGHANHSLFWKSLKKGTTLQGDLKAAIERDFGSVENFKAEFEKAAADVYKRQIHYANNTQDAR